MVGPSLYVVCPLGPKIPTKMLDEQEQWFVQNQSQISERIEEGLAELERGDEVDAAEAITILRQRRAEWIKRNSR